MVSRSTQSRIVSPQRAPLTDCEGATPTRPSYRNTLPHLRTCLSGRRVCCASSLDRLHEHRRPLRASRTRDSPRATRTSRRSIDSRTHQSMDSTDSGIIRTPVQPVLVTWTCLIHVCVCDRGLSLCARGTAVSHRGASADRRGLSSLICSEARGCGARERNKK